MVRRIDLKNSRVFSQVSKFGGIRIWGMPKAICTQLLSLSQGIGGKICWGRNGGEGARIQNFVGDLCYFPTLKGLKICRVGGVHTV